MESVEIGSSNLDEIKSGIDIAKRDIDLSDQRTEILIKLRCSPEWKKKFEAVKGKAKQLRTCWDKLGLEIGKDVSGKEAQNEYNYLIGQFKKHSKIAKRSGEGAIRWKWYSILKPLIGNDHNIKPLNLLDTANSSTEINLYPIDEKMIKTIDDVKGPPLKISKKSNPIDPMIELFQKSLAQREILLNSICSTSEKDIENSVNDASLVRLEHKFEFLEDKVASIFNSIDKLTDKMEEFFNKFN